MGDRVQTLSFEMVVPILRRFYDQHRLDRMVSLPILLGWVKEGKAKAKEAGQQGDHQQAQGEEAEVG